MRAPALAVCPYPSYMAANLVNVFMLHLHTSRDPWNKIDDRTPSDGVSPGATRHRTLHRPAVAKADIGSRPANGGSAPHARSRSRPATGSGADHRSGVCNQVSCTLCIRARAASQSALTGKVVLAIMKIGPVATPQQRDIDRMTVEPRCCRHIRRSTIAPHALWTVATKPGSISRWLLLSKAAARPQSSFIAIRATVTFCTIPSEPFPRPSRARSQ